MNNCFNTEEGQVLKEDIIELIKILAVNVENIDSHFRHEIFLNFFHQMILNENENTSD